MAEQIEIDGTRPAQSRPMTREDSITYAAIMRLRRAGFRVCRTQTKDIHNIDGIHYSGEQLRQLAAVLKDEDQ